MAIEYDKLAHPKGPSRYETTKAKHGAAMKHYRDVCAQATLRDGSCCRVCQRWCNPRAIAMLAKLHHHHLIPISLGGVDESWNLACLCADCHDAEHGGKIRLSGNADDRNEMGRLAGIKLERMTESGWQIAKWI
jgi:hypothetical protein